MSPETRESLKYVFSLKNNNILVYFNQKNAILYVCIPLEIKKFNIKINNILMIRLNNTLIKIKGTEI